MDDEVALNNIEFFIQTDKTNLDSDGRKKFVWMSHQCRHPGCYPMRKGASKKFFQPPPYIPNFTCNHLNTLRDSELDTTDRVIAKGKGDMRGRLTAVVAPLRFEANYRRAKDRLLKHIMLGVHFPELSKYEQMLPTEPTAGDLWLVKPSSDAAGGANYVFHAMVTQGVAFGNIKTMSMKRVRKIGLSELAASLYEGTKCEGHLHEIDGAPIFSYSARPSTKDNSHRSMDTLENVASILMFGKCIPCRERSDRPLGLADF